jgi:hypothetical protein
MAESPSAKVRADGAHFFALTENDKAVPYLRRLAEDENTDVREIAEEALNELVRH